LLLVKVIAAVSLPHPVMLVTVFIVGIGFTVAVTWVRIGLVQSLRVATAQKLVVAEMSRIKSAPLALVPSSVPPVAALYQRIVASASIATARKATSPAPQRETEVVVSVVLIGAQFIRSDTMLQSP
jgi:hypothetical protein